jgi:hypothetical protein
VAQLVEVLRCKPEGRWRYYRWNHCNFSLTQSFRSHYGCGGSTQPRTEMTTRNVSLRGKGGRGVGLTTLPPSCADCLEIWEPQPPGTLRACPGLYRDSFTIACYFVINFLHVTRLKSRILRFVDFFGICVLRYPYVS